MEEGRQEAGREEGEGLRVRGMSKGMLSRERGRGTERRLLKLSGKNL